MLCVGYIIVKKKRCKFCHTEKNVLVEEVDMNHIITKINANFQLR